MYIYKIFVWLLNNSCLPNPQALPSSPAKGKSSENFLPLVKIEPITAYISKLFKNHQAPLQIDNQPIDLVTSQQHKSCKVWTPSLKNSKTFSIFFPLSLDEPTTQTAIRHLILSQQNLYYPHLNCTNLSHIFILNSLF